MKIKHLAMSFLMSSAWFTPAMAGSGNAILPLWGANSAQGAGTGVYITNVTSHTLNIGVTFYDTTGAVTTCPVAATNLITSNTQIAAGATAQIFVTCTTSTFGIARIQWSNQGSDQDTTGLVAVGIRYITYGSALDHHAIPVNGSNPF